MRRAPLTDFNAQGERIQALLESGRLGRARVLALRLIEADPQHPGPWYDLGRIHSRRKQYKDAIRSFKNCIERDPETPHAYFALANAWKKAEHLKLALASYEKAIEIDSDFTDAYINLGLTLTDLGWFRKADIVLKRAVKLASNEADSHTALARNHWHLGDLESALREYRIGLALDPCSARIQGYVKTCLDEMARRGL